MNYIKLRKNNLCVENISALKLVKKYKTPFYCYSLSQLKNNYYILNNAFKTVKPIICFSVKSNSNLTLLKELKKMGSGADVVSIGELLKATKVGISAKKIVFSGVGKTEEEIRMAIKKRVLLINVESESEVNLINKISKKISKKTSIGIRLNPNVMGKTHQKISTGGKDEKFGLTYNDFVNLCIKIRKMKNLKLEGISVHIGSQITNVKPFKKVLSEINKVVFKVNSSADKKSIKKSIEKIFKVNVIKINIINKQRRIKIARGKKAKVRGYKKAIITLKKGQNIDLTTGIWNDIKNI